MGAGRRVRGDRDDEDDGKRKRQITGDAILVCCSSLQRRSTLKHYTEARKHMAPDIQFRYMGYLRRQRAPIGPRLGVRSPAKPALSGSGVRRRDHCDRRSTGSLRQVYSHLLPGVIRSPPRRLILGR